MCDGRSPTPDELPTCYEGDDWSGVSLQEFMDCSYNLANNRQYSKQEEHQKNRQKRREERRLLREQRAHQWSKEETAEEITVTEDYNSQVARW
ncbi:hypothetical protein Y1Q_0021093 [Alligator mississippiensis]|nr:hypothetical protein Y1Q_0021093 [Alligator mississippiensis]